MLPLFVKKPWGSFTEYTVNQASTVKTIHVDPGQALSLQLHEHRSEFWKIIRGNARITVGDKVSEGKEGEEFFVPKKTKHRIEAVDAPVDILEIATGQFDEDDIVRLEDKYGRT